MSDEKNRNTGSATLVVRSDFLHRMLGEDPEFAVAVKQNALRRAAKTFFKEITPEEVQEMIQAESRKALATVRSVVQKQFGDYKSPAWREIFKPTEKFSMELRRMVRKEIDSELGEMIQEELQRQIDRSLDMRLRPPWLDNYVKRQVSENVKELVREVVRRYRVKMAGDIQLIKADEADEADGS